MSIRHLASLSSLFGEDAEILTHRDFQLLLLANPIGPLGLALLSPVLETLIGPFGVTEGDIGLVMSAYTAPAIVVIPLAGVLSDRIGRKPLLVAGLLTVGAGGGGIALTTDFRFVLALRALQGIGAAAVVPVIVTSIGDLYDGAPEAAGQGFRFTTSGLTLMVFPPLAGLLVGFGWQYPLYLYLLAIPVAVLVYGLMTEPTDADAPIAEDDAPAVEDDASAVEDDAPTTQDDGAGETASDDDVSLRTLLVNRRIQAIVFVRILPPMVWIGFLTYVSIVAVRFIGGSPVDAGILTSTASLVYAAMATQAGRITVYFESRLYPLVASNVALGCGFAVVLVAPTMPVAALGTVSLGIGFGLLPPIHRSIITDLAPESLRGSLVSLTEAASRLGLTATPICMGATIGLTTEHLGFELAVQAAGLGVALFAATGGIVGLLLARRAPPPPHLV